MNGIIALENGSVYHGEGFTSGQSDGEVVFTTGYSGYEESLTDPSYKGQILNFCYPLIGNYGVNEERFESYQVQVEGAIAREFDESLKQTFEWFDVPSVHKLDTRRLTKEIREEGCLKGSIVSGQNVSEDLAFNIIEQSNPMPEKEYVHTYSTFPNYRQVNKNSDVNLTIIDCGMKFSILDNFKNKNVNINIIPHTEVFEYIDILDTDILFISNGPGHPENYEHIQNIVKEYIEEIPVTGICLGHQIISLAMGGSISKLKYGHRGLNQPVYNTNQSKVSITTQNHNYYVESCDKLDTLEYNINDETIESLVNDELNILTTQYHPEANPGPRDSIDVFDKIVDLSE